MRTSQTRDGSSPSHAAPPVGREVISRECIAASIRRESARSDRNGREFALVLFRVKPGQRPPVSDARFARELADRARLTDEVGWFDERHLCAILPETSVAGANTFAQSVCDRVSRHAPTPVAAVFAYPGRWLELQNANQGSIEQRPAAAAPHSRHDDDDSGRSDGNGHAGGDGHSNGNGHGSGRGAAQQVSGEHVAARTHLHDARGRSSGSGSGNGHSNGNGHGNGNGKAHQVPESGPATAVLERRHLMASFNDGFAAELARPGLPTDSVQSFLAHAMPAWKRVIDLIGATLMLVLLSPVMIAAAMAIILTSRGPIIFRQKRSGLGGRPFTIFKFRTMCTDAERRKHALRRQSEQDGPAFKIANDPRVTQVGKLLRKTSIDELPQLWNVLRGEMSLVGPRPLPCEEAAACMQWQQRRLDVTPGLTCIWQVDGRSRVTFDEWVRMDVAYIRRRTLLHDMSILLRTVPAVLMRRGAH